MVDPSIPLRDFQEGLEKNLIKLHPCKVDTSLWLYYDEPIPGMHRITYVRLNKDKVVTAFLMVAPAESYRGLRCFALGVATPEPYRGRGNAQEIVRAAIEEVKWMSKTMGEKEFYLDACISVDNIASQRVAEQVFKIKGEPGTDGLSGKPVLQYFLKVSTD